MEYVTYATEKLLAPAWDLVGRAMPVFLISVFRAHPVRTAVAFTAGGLAAALVARRTARQRHVHEPALAILAAGELASLVVAQLGACLLSTLAWTPGLNNYSFTATFLVGGAWITRAYAHYRLLLLTMDLAVVQAGIHVLWRLFRSLERACDIQGVLMFAIVKVMQGGDVVEDGPRAGDYSVNAIAQLMAAGMTVRCDGTYVQSADVGRMLHQPQAPGDCFICKDDTEPCGTRLNCCAQYVHAACLLHWVKDHPSCPHCRKPLHTGALLALRHLQVQFRAREAKRMVRFGLPGQPTWE